MPSGRWQWQNNWFGQVNQKERRKMANKRWSRIFLLLALLLAAVYLASCSKTEIVDETSSIVIVIPEDPPSFNAMISDTGYDALVMELVLLGLTDLDANGNVIPELATSLPTLENGDVVMDEENWTMDVTWRLREGVVWQDGEAVTVDDVLFTYEAIANPETGGWIPGLDYIDSVEKVDDYTLIVHYNSVYPGYLLQFGGEQVVIWPAHYCDAAQGFIAWDCARQPLSNGPYMLEEWVVGDHLTFVKNPDYYQEGKPTIEQITVRIVPDDTVRRTMLLKGDAHVIPWVTEPIAHELESETGVTLSISPTSRWVMRLFPNLALRGTQDPIAAPHPVLSDVRVRQAIRSAIDVDTISDDLFYGYGDPVWSEFFRPPYNTCTIPQPVYDPEASRALLEEAGWTDSDGDGVRECHGCATAEEGYVMEIEIITYSEYGEVLALTEQLIGEQLNSIGIGTRLTVMEGSVMWADSASGGIEQLGDFDLDLYDDGYAGVDPTDFLWQYYAADAALPDYGWNVGRWYNEEFEGLLSEAYTLDETYRQEIFCRMAEILYDEVPQILLFTTINADAFNNQLSGLQSSPNDMVTWNVADWTLTVP
jgi:peptide/nickel transport system substrate-binding protein